MCCTAAQCTSVLQNWFARVSFPLTAAKNCAAEDTAAKNCTAEESFGGVGPMSDQTGHQQTNFDGKSTKMALNGFDRPLNEGRQTFDRVLTDP